MTRRHATCLIVLVVAGCGVARTRDHSTAVSDIELSYKRDPRMVDPYRGLKPWVAGPAYSGATAQDKIEARARGIDGNGREVRTKLRWTPSDPQMVTVSPDRGDAVTIAVHRDGESRVRITDGGFTKELVIRARHEGTFVVVDIAPAAVVGPAQAAAAQISPSLKSKRDQVSYAVGLNVARTLQKQSITVDPDLVRQGFKDALYGGATLMTEEQAHLLLVGVATEINVTEADLERRRWAEKNRTDGERFLAGNRNKPGVVTLPSGLQYRVLTQGNGPTPTLDDVAVCHYRGMFVDGTEFDSSYRHKTHEPVRFPLRGIIPAWQQVLPLMPAGSKWQLFVPPTLAYGDRGAPRSHIGPNTAVIFEVELLSVESSAPHQPLSTPRVSTAELPPEVVDQLKRAVHAQTQKEMRR